MTARKDGQQGMEGPAADGAGGCYPQNKHLSNAYRVRLPAFPQVDNPIINNKILTRWKIKLLIWLPLKFRLRSQ